MAEPGDVTAEGKGAATMPPPGIPVKLVIMIVGGAVILGLGGAFAFYKLLSHSNPEAAAPVQQAAPAPAAAHSEPPKAAPVSTAVGAAGEIFDLDPFVVNLADSETHYLKVTVKLELERSDVKDELTKRTPQVRDAILILLTSKETSNVRTTQGKYQLRDEVMARVNAVLPRGGVRGAYFADFVVQ